MNDPTWIRTSRVMTHRPFRVLRAAHGGPHRVKRWGPQTVQSAPLSVHNRARHTSTQSRSISEEQLSLMCASHTREKTTVILISIEFKARRLRMSWLFLLSVRDFLLLSLRAERSNPAELRDQEVLVFLPNDLVGARFVTVNHVYPPFLTPEKVEPKDRWGRQMRSMENSLSCVDLHRLAAPNPGVLTMRFPLPPGHATHTDSTGVGME